MAQNISNETNTYAYMMKVNETVNCIFIALCMPLILVGNIMVIISVAKFRKLQTTMNYFVSNLAVADLLVGFPVIPLYMSFFLMKSLSSLKYMCLFKYTWVLIGLPASALNLLLVTIDRYIAILHPLHYGMLMTKYKAKIMIACIWIYSLVTATMPLYGVNRWREGTDCEFWTVLPKTFTILTVPVMQCISLFTTFILYLKIFHRAINFQENSKRAKKQDFMQKRMKNAKVMAIVFSMFLLFWMPLLTSSVLKYTSLPSEIIEMVKAISLSLAMSNSLINPIIYCWIRPDFRTAFKILLHFKVLSHERHVLQRNDT